MQVVVKSAAAALFLLIFILHPTFASGDKRNPDLECLEYRTCITKSDKQTTTKYFVECNFGCAAWRCVKNGVFYFGYGCGGIRDHNICRGDGEPHQWVCGPGPYCASVDETPPSNLSDVKCDATGGIEADDRNRYRVNERPNGNGIYETTKMDAFKFFGMMVIGWIFMYGW